MQCFYFILNANVLCNIKYRIYINLNKDNDVKVCKIKLFLKFTLLSINFAILVMCGTKSEDRLLFPTDPTAESPTNAHRYL